MIFLVSGLALFFAAHFYSAFRSRVPEQDIKSRMGEGAYMGLYSLVSAVGLGLIVFGYWSAPAMDTLYAPPTWARPIAQVGGMVALMLVVSAYVPANHIGRRLRHPMILATGVWAGSHLLSSSDAKELLLFGSFLLFAVTDSIRAFNRPYVPERAATLRNDVLVVFVAAGLYGVIALGLHALLFGVSAW